MIEFSDDIPKTLIKWSRKRVEQIQRLFAEYDNWSGRPDGKGYWLMLRDGWCVDSEGQHWIHEETIVSLQAAFSGVQRCQCEDCKEFNNG